MRGSAGAQQSRGGAGAIDGGGSGGSGGITAVNGGTGISVSTVAGVATVTNTGVLSVNLNGGGPMAGVVALNTEVPLTFSNGVTRTVNTVKNDLITGIAGNQTIISNTAANGNLTLLSSNAANPTGGVYVGAQTSQGILSGLTTRGAALSLGVDGTTTNAAVVFLGEDTTHGLYMYYRGGGAPATGVGHIGTNNQLNDLFIEGQSLYLNNPTSAGNVIIGNSTFASTTTIQTQKLRVNTGVFSIAATAGGSWLANLFSAGPLTLTGSTTTTNYLFASGFGGPSISGGGTTQTVLEAANVLIGAAPTGTNGVTITHPWSLATAARCVHSTFYTIAVAAGAVYDCFKVGTPDGGAASYNLSVTGSGTITELAVSRFNAVTTVGQNPGFTATKFGTVVIDGAPIAGSFATFTNSYALWIKSGQSQFDGYVYVGSDGGGVLSPSFAALRSGTNKGIIEAQGTAGDINSGIVIINSISNVRTTQGSFNTRLFVSADGSWDWASNLGGSLGSNVCAASTVTFTTPTNTSMNFIYGTYLSVITYTAAASTPIITEAATLKIAGPPIGGGTLVITNPFSMICLGGIAKFTGAGGGAAVFDLPLDATVNVVASTGRIPFQSGSGTTKYLHYYDS